MVITAQQARGLLRFWGVSAPQNRGSKTAKNYHDFGVHRKIARILRRTSCCDFGVRSDDSAVVAKSCACVCCQGLWGSW